MTKRNWNEVIQSDEFKALAASPPKVESDRIRAVKAIVYNAVCSNITADRAAVEIYNLYTPEPAPVESGVVETVARAICIADGDTPDTIASNGPYWKQYIDLAEAAIAALASSKEERVSEAMRWFSDKHFLELFYYSPMRCDDDDQSSEWRVAHRSGSINDREWTEIGRGETPVDAINDARQRQDGEARLDPKG